MLDLFCGGAARGGAGVSLEDQGGAGRWPALPAADDPMLQQVNRLRRLLAALEAIQPAEPIQFPQHMYGCGCAYCRGVVGQPPPSRR